MTIALFLGIGLGAGVLSGMFGIGGGVVIVPLLIWLAKMAPRAAVGTSLAAILSPASIFGAYTYWKSGDLDIRAALALSAGLLVGAGIGARLAQFVDGVVIQRAFAVLMVLLAVKVWWGAPDAAARAKKPAGAATAAPHRSP